MSIYLAEPLWLGLLIFIILFWRFHACRRHELDNFIKPHLWRWVIYNQVNSDQFTRITQVIALALMIIALSQPVLTNESASTATKTDAVFVFDASRSMALTDIAPSRIGKARIIAHQLIDNLSLSQQAVILVTGHAYTLLPLNSNLSATHSTIEYLDTNLTQSPGSNLGLGIEKARELLQVSHAQQKLIFLFTDGDTRQTQSAITEASLLNKENIRLYTLGIATLVGQPVTDINNEPATMNAQIIYSRLAIELLETMATSADGRFFNTNIDSINKIISLSRLDMTSHRASKIDNANSNATYPLYIWPLILGLTLYLWASHKGWRQGVALGIVSTSLLLSPQTSQASIWSESRAYQALLEGRYNEAIALYRHGSDYTSLIGLGAAFYKNKQWSEALEAFIKATKVAQSDTDHARAYFNCGNTLTQLGQFNRAETAYRQALNYQTFHKGASNNLELLRQKQSKAGDDIKSTADTTRQDNQQQQTDERLAGAEVISNKTQQQISTFDNPTQSEPNPEPADQVKINNVNDESNTGRMIKYRINKQDQLLPRIKPAQTW